jgi:addiction module HigA family antidote
MGKAEADVSLKPTTPGDVIENYLEHLGMSHADLAKRTGLSAKTINELIAGKCAVTPATALKLEPVLGRPALFWNNLESVYQIKTARAEERKNIVHAESWLKTIPIAELTKRGFLNLNPGDDVYAKLKEVLRFYGVASIDAYHEVWDRHLSLAARKDKKAETELGPASAWIRQGEIEAEQMECQDYDKTKFKAALEKIRGWTTEPIAAASRKTKEICAPCGVAVTFVREMPKVPWNGMTRWITPKKALIIMSIRGKGEDRFWFTFFHEASHVLNEEGKKTFLINSKEYKESPEEKRADKFAEDFLIPPEWNQRIQSAKSPQEIERLAGALKIAPGIVAGRYQHLTSKYFMFKDLINTLAWAPATSNGTAW